MKEDKIDTKKEFSLLKRSMSFAYAGRGVLLFLKGTPNALIDLAIFLMVTLLGFYFQITSMEWIIIVMVSGFVFVSEAFNTAIEIDIDLTSPEYHPYARDTKDVAAGAVLISAVIAVVVGLIIFLPYFFKLVA